MTLDALLERSRRILDGARHLTLATSSPDGRPWSTPLHYVWLPDPLRLLFTSVVDSRHGRDIAARPTVSGSLVVTGPLSTVDGELPSTVDSTVDAGVETTAAEDGAQFTATCVEVPPAEVDHYHDRFFGTLFPDPAVRQRWALPPTAFRAPAPHRLYLATVRQWWVPDLAGWVRDRVDRRLEVPVQALPGPRGTGVS
ncbi:pyridoxamine 5'-phosphate oxidase family protein [Streptoalloteichus hindustanus]|uniref:Pyridoxamine 5'-phosphate oxidase n=1 Tax=Streptoalloteichus hindustanus TaxID=2017 RepID=A0A1M5HZH8_STRHI|nr:pyridoxamine 5'-phosphate oxidase family protein [Streptoalloteichus hindustanus]SHG21418.1 Pyridoxamine 5'-phosphate oxidase [Streptoalloteichus hindustanus]